MLDELVHHSTLLSAAVPKLCQTTLEAYLSSLATRRHVIEAIAREFLDSPYSLANEALNAQTGPFGETCGLRLAKLPNQ
jgi:hypothetical protein